MAFVELTDARRSLAEKLTGYILFTSGCQVSPPSGTYVGVANGADATRHIVSTDLVLLDVAGTGTPAATDRWKYASVYIPSTQLQRKVSEKGYSGAKLASDVTDQASLTTTYVGMLTLAEILSSALAASIECELHSVMPPFSRETGMGLHACLNRALRAMKIRDSITLTKVANSRRYSLGQYSWLTEDDQLIRVGDSETLANTDGNPLFGGGTIRTDGETAYLLINTEPSSTTFTFDVWRPRSSWVRVGGTWQPSTAGLVNEDDAVSVDPDWLTFLAYTYACESLARAWRHDPAGAWWQSEYDKHSPTAERRLRQERALDVPLPAIGRSDTITSRDTIATGRSWP
jgi:hypothetical protein